MSNRFVGDQNFLWFFAEIVDVNDPDKLGQYKIRIRGFHDGLPDDKLPWAMSIAPIMSASYKRQSDDDAVGISPTGILKESFVFGFFADGSTAKVPVIFGTVPQWRPEPGTEKPLVHHDVAKAAREINVWQNKNLVGPEPPSPYAAIYPNNKVWRTQSGHTVEIDDSQAAERIHVYHKSGSYVEMRPDGSVVFKSVKDNYEIVSQNDFDYVGQNEDVQIGQNSTTKIGADQITNVSGKINTTSGSTINIKASGQINIKGSRVVISGSVDTLTVK